MCRFNIKLLINFTLILALFMAPFEVLFASGEHINLDTFDGKKISAGFEKPAVVSNDSTNTGDSTVAVFSVVHDRSASHHHSMGLNKESGIDKNNIHKDNIDKKCEKHCTHCVFCSAAVLSSFRINVNIQSVYNSHINRFSSGVFSDVDIRPPKNIKFI